MKQLLAKIVGLIAVLVVCQMLFAGFSGYKDKPATVVALEVALVAETTVLYFGDSTLYRGDYAEVDQRSLPVMLGDLLPNTSVAGIYHDAYHLELLEFFCRYAVEDTHKPDVIVLPINMRSFSDERVMRPEYQFVKEKLFLGNRGVMFASFFRPLAVFRAFDLTPISQEEYLDIEMFDGEERLGTFGEFMVMPYHEGLPRHVRACYRYRLDGDHAHVKALGRIAAMCRDAGVRLIVYSTPTDYEQGEGIIGEDFSEGIRLNLEIVEETLAEYDVELINLTFSFEGASFSNGSYPDAYIRSEAKAEVAGRLADAILEGE